VSRKEKRCQEAAFWDFEKRCRIEVALIAWNGVTQSKPITPNCRLVGDQTCVAGGELAIMPDGSSIGMNTSPFPEKSVNE
jgi:hypothetical protein